MRGAGLYTVFWMIVLLCFTTNSKAQQGLFIPKNGKVHFGGDTATIFSSVINNGKLGVGRKAVVNFKGTVWENDPAAVISDESDTTTGIGGWIRFMNDAVAQQLRSGYNIATQQGATFPNLQIANPFGLYLSQSSAKVRHEFSFEKGLVYLNGNVFVVGHKKPGKISGYTSDKFFVTNSRSGGGLLLRENIRSSDNMVVFPIGTTGSSYTPVAIRSKTSLGDNYFASVFDSVKSHLFNGTDLSRRGVNKTWEIGKLLHPGQGEAEVHLQHLTAEEGDQFKQNRTRTYISQYLRSAWDTGIPQFLPLMGTLTTATGSHDGGLNYRTFTTTLSQSSYFTKFAADDTLITKLIWGAYRLSRTNVVANWQTKPEINVKHFVLQRRLANEASFSDRVSIRSQALHRVSLGYLNYSFNDANSYPGISYYRLQVFDYSGQSYFTNIVAVSGDIRNKILLWPNPTPDQFSVIVNSPMATSLVIYNALGQKMYSQSIAINNQNVVEVKGHGLISGAYFVSILDKEGNVLDNAKLIIQK
jgi:hypothetical protein